MICESVYNPVRDFAVVIPGLVWQSMFVFPIVVTDFKFNFM